MLSRKPISKTIRDKQYTALTLPALEGLQTGTKLFKVLAPSLGSVLDGLQHDDILHGESRSFTNIAETIVTHLDESVVIEAIQKVTEGMTCNTTPVNFDAHFSANYGEMLEVLQWLFMENFESFFEQRGLKSIWGNLLNLTATEQDEQPQE